MSEDPFLPQRKQLFFALYTVAAAIYRWVVTFSICWFLYKLFESYQLKVIGQLVVAMSLWARCFSCPSTRSGVVFLHPGEIGQSEKVAFLSESCRRDRAGGAISCFYRCRSRFWCRLKFKPGTPESVNVEVPGTLAAINVKQGQYVTQGTLLGELSEPNLDVEIEADPRPARSDEKPLEGDPRKSVLRAGMSWPPKKSLKSRSR